MNVRRLGAAVVEADVEPDWSREAKGWFEWAPPKALLASIRAYQRHRASRAPWAVPMRWLSVLRHRFWSVVCGADIPLNSRLGGGLVLLHPQGIVIHPRATVGANCMIFQQVTLGMRGAHSGVPTLGHGVEVGAGAKILGGVAIGHHAKIGANAVVIDDVPDGATAVGAPARIVRPGIRQTGT
jgi:serine O-acetyltransferase